MMLEFLTSSLWSISGFIIQHLNWSLLLVDTELRIDCILELMFAGFEFFSFIVSGF